MKIELPVVNNCTICGKGLKAYETWGKDAPYCKPCWGEHIAPRFSSETKEGRILAAMCEKYEIGPATRVLAVVVYERSGFRKAARVLWGQRR